MDKSKVKGDNPLCGEYSAIAQVIESLVKRTQLKEPVKEVSVLIVTVCGSPLEGGHVDA